MSSILSSGLYIYDSHENYSSRETFGVLSEVFQNILDDHYRDPKKLYLDTIELKTSAKPVIGAVVKGISLGDKSVELYSKSDVGKYIRGVRGRIGIIYELDGKKMNVDLGDIQSITHAHVIDRVNIHPNENDTTRTLIGADSGIVLQKSIAPTLPRVSH